jgi:hypothetical protein
MRYAFTEKEMTIEQANRLLRVIWGTCDDSAIHEDYLDDFTKDRIELYSHLGKDARISLTVDFVESKAA